MMKSFFLNIIRVVPFSPTGFNNVKFWKLFILFNFDLFNFDFCKTFIVFFFFVCLFFFFLFTAYQLFSGHLAPNQVILIKVS